MNAYFSTPLAIILTLFAAFMWGSWMQIVKLKRDYPIMGIVFLLYQFSFLLIWGITLLLAPRLLPSGLFAELSSYNWHTVGKILLGGAAMSVGMIFNLTVMNRIGLTLATTLSGTITSILGILTSISEEGMPDNPHALLVIILTTVTFLLASYLCSTASKMCTADRMKTTEADSSKNPKGGVTVGVIAMILLNSFLVNGWASGTAAGTAAGLPPIITCALMVTGSAVSVLIVGVILFTYRHQWKTVLCIGSSKRPLVLSAVSAVCHYGGNLLSIYAMPAISATLSFLFGKTSNIWTYFWGLYYGEFKGSRRITKIVLAVGLFLYFGGLALLFFYNYG